MKQLKEHTRRKQEWQAQAKAAIANEFEVPEERVFISKRRVSRKTARFDLPLTAGDIVMNTRYELFEVMSGNFGVVEADAALGVLCERIGRLDKETNKVIHESPSP